MATSPDSPALPDVLVVMALPLESQGLFEAADVPVLYTGIGKINAACALTRRLAEYRHARQALRFVVNFGTAGSRSHNRGTLVACDRFVQRDMDVTGLGFDLGVTPFESVPAELQVEQHFGALLHGRCGTGDSFAMAPPALACDVIDMEAYALAKVCHLEQVPFACAKFVTDGADGTAAADWQQSLRPAAEAFLRLYRTL